MGKHKPICLLVTILVVIGGLNWGLIGLGGFLNKDLNVVHMILASLPAAVEWVVYIIVGLASLALGYICLSCKNCDCQTKK